MNRKAFRQLVIREAGSHPSNRVAVGDRAMLDDLIQSRIDELCERALCLYDPKVSLVIQANSQIVGLKTTSGTPRVSKRVIFPQHVTVNSEPLRAISGKSGPIGVRDLFDFHRQWQSATAGPPARWAWLPDDQLFLHPKTDAAYTGLNFVSGFVLPDVMSAETSETGLDGEAERIAAKFVAIEIVDPDHVEMTPRGDVASKQNRYARLVAETERWIESSRAKSERQAFGANRVRARANGEGVVVIGTGRSNG